MKQNIFLINKENGKVIKVGNPKSLELPAEMSLMSR